MLANLGFQTQITHSSAELDGTRTHNKAYLQLREALKEHIQSGTAPVLLELPKPSHFWERDPTLADAYSHATDQLGEIEEVDIFLDGPDPLASPEDFPVS